MFKTFLLRFFEEIEYMHINDGKGRRIVQKGEESI